MSRVSRTTAGESLFSLRLPPPHSLSSSRAEERKNCHHGHPYCLRHHGRLRLQLKKVLGSSLRLSCPVVVSLAKRRRNDISLVKRSRSKEPRVTPQWLPLQRHLAATERRSLVSASHRERPTLSRERSARMESEERERTRRNEDKEVFPSSVGKGNCDDA